MDISQDDDVTLDGMQTGWASLVQGVSERPITAGFVVVVPVGFLISVIYFFIEYLNIK